MKVRNYSEFLVVLTAVIPTIIAVDLTFFEHNGHRGSQLHMQNVGRGCQSLPNNWHDEISSVNTHGHCIIVFEHPGCHGKKSWIAPDTSSHNSFGDFGLNDMVSSFKLCDGRRKRSAPDANMPAIADLVKIEEVVGNSKRFNNTAAISV